MIVFSVYYNYTVIIYIFAR